MAQFNFINDMNNLMNLDGDLKTQSKPRWQRKMQDSMNGSNLLMNASGMMNSSKLSVSYNNGYASALSASTANNNKTPNKSGADATKKKTPNDKKSPGR